MNVRDILEDLGYQVDLAADGAAALHLALTQRYDIALLDYMMPGMNGVELYTQLRQTHPEIVAIMITAYAGEDGIEAAYDAGAWQVLRKPLNIASLIPLLDQAAHRPIVLVIDDDEAFCKNLWETLGNYDYRVNLAHTEAEGIRKASDAKYSTAIVDLKLGNGDGRRVIELIRQLRPEARVVLLTGVQASAAELEVEVDAMCYKPVDMTELLELIAPPV